MGGAEDGEYVEASPPEILEIYEILIWESFTTALAFIMSTD